jgi:hypothetical protein
MTRLAVVYLAWGPAGIEPVHAFAESYRHHAAGADHELLVALKSVADPAPVRDAFASVEHRELEVSGDVLDLGTYRQVADREDAARLCFLNTTAEVLHAGWLGLLDGALDGDDVGLAGASGSWETPRSGVAPHGLSTVRAVRHAIGSRVTWPLRARRFPSFPNPHVRTNAFVLERDLIRDLDWPAVTRKQAAWSLESGRRSITRQVHERGLRAVVAGRDGRVYLPAEWAGSATFRASEQENLLVADRRTRDFADAGPEERRAQTLAAWGARA